MHLMQLRDLLVEQLRGSSFEAETYFAGGCVRDWLLDKQTELQEADVCVHLEEGGIKLADFLCSSLHGSQFISHPEFGTAAFSYEGLRLEFVATRKEMYRKNSRFPQVSFGSLEEDVLRRDFTINSLLMQVSTANVLDLTGMGLDDLRAGLIRCIGNPREKFREDPLRLIRAFRFAVRFGFTIEPLTREAWQSEAGGLRKLSRRAIESELNKLDAARRGELTDRLGHFLGSYSDNNPPDSSTNNS